ncbi:MAG: rhamnogalacturonan acetylesterase [Kiritimatiellales bacterium]
MNCLLSIVFALICAVSALAEVKVLVAGDSTVWNKAPKYGWGDCIEPHFKKGIKVTNLAIGGRSSKSFITEGRWDDLISRVVPGDVVFVQFGHNDQKILVGYEIGTHPDGEYKDNLRRFADEVAAKKGRLVFVTPPRRLTYKSSEPTVLRTDLQVYCDAMKEVAAEKKRPVVDLYALTGEGIQAMGEEKAWVLFDTGDRSHFSKTGAEWVAKLIMDTVRAENMLPAELLK